MTYQQALREASRVGARNAQGKAYTAMMASLVARSFCLNAEVVYQWAVKHNENIKEIIRQKCIAPMDNLDLVDAILADIPLREV